MTPSLRILLADDHPIWRAGVASSLQAREGWKVVAEADDADTALFLAEGQTIDVALIDLSMPGLRGKGGIGLLEALSARRPEMRLIVLTASDDPDGLMDALRAGAHGYLLKGASSTELRDIVERVSRGDAFVPPALAARLLIELGRPRQPPGQEALTARETEVLALVADGLTNREIGERLHLAEKTIKHHVTQVLAKLQVRSRTEAALVAQRRAGRTHG